MEGKNMKTVYLLTIRDKADFSVTVARKVFSDGIAAETWALNYIEGALADEPDKSFRYQGRYDYDIEDFLVDETR